MQPCLRAGRMQTAISKDLELSWPISGVTLCRRVSLDEVAHVHTWRPLCVRPYHHAVCRSTIWCASPSSPVELRQQVRRRASRLNLTSGNPAHASSGSFAGTIVRTIVALLIVIAVIYGLTWILKQSRVHAQPERRGRARADRVAAARARTARSRWSGSAPSCTCWVSPSTVSTASASSARRRPTSSASPSIPTTSTRPAAWAAVQPVQRVVDVAPTIHRQLRRLTVR